jgi:hypothetical protein
MGRNGIVEWAGLAGLVLVGFGFALGACGAKAPVGSFGARLGGPSGGDPLAVGWALKAAVSEARGDAIAAERAHAWVARLDRGAWARLRQADFERRQGRLEEARATYASVVGTGVGDLDDPLVVRAMLGLGLVAAGADEADLWLGPLVERAPCRVLEGPISTALREQASTRCLQRRTKP